MENRLVFIDDFLDETDLRFYQNFIKSYNHSQTIIENQMYPSQFLEKYKEKLSDVLTISTILPKVTITNSIKPVIKHTDCKYQDENYKLLIYLNDIPNGGTVFFDGRKSILVENKKNRLVIFDISLPHESQSFTGNVKKLAIGFRVKGELIRS